MKGKLIVIEGTDCSGKETQTKLLVEKLKEENINVKRYSFPMYDTPTGKIVGGPYLGKGEISDCWFKEGATNVTYKVASLYYAADRVYNIEEIKDDINKGYTVILDRYVYSNMAHQGGKELEKEKRYEIYNWLYDLEFNLLSLPIPDIKVLLYMPTEYSKILKKNRESIDQHEQNEEYLNQASIAYQEVASLYDFSVINCISNNKIRSIEEINEELIKIIKK